MRFFIFVVLFCTACGNSNAPLDADARRQVDSLSASGIGIARRDLDSICKTQRTTLLPSLVDSIKNERLQEIKRQLENVPK